MGQTLENRIFACNPDVKIVSINVFPYAIKLQKVTGSTFSEIQKMWQNLGVLLQKTELYQLRIAKRRVFAQKLDFFTFLH